MIAHPSYRPMYTHPSAALGFFSVEDQARKAASYAAGLLEEEMVARMPGILKKLQPDINAAASNAMRSAMQDQAFKSAIAGIEETAIKYFVIGGIIGVVATSALSSFLTWWLIQNYSSRP